MIIEIPAHVIRGAMKCQATIDVRHYLKAVAFNGDTGEVVGTDGHLLYIAEVESLKGAFSGIRLLRIPQKIPVKPKTIYFDTDKNTLELDELGVHLICEVISGDFPDYTKVIPTEDGQPMSSEFGLNPKLVERAIKALEVDSGSGHLWSQCDDMMVIKPMSGSNPHRIPAKTIIMRLRG